MRTFLMINTKIAPEIGNFTSRIQKMLKTSTKEVNSSINYWKMGPKRGLLPVQ